MFKRNPVNSIFIFSFKQTIDFSFLEEGKVIKEHIDKGLLLPDNLVLKFVAAELKKLRDKGFLLDGKLSFKNTTSSHYFTKKTLGYPRTINQAQLLNKEIKVDHVLQLNVPNDEIVNRLKDRWVHAPSGRVYNLLWNPPKVAVRISMTQLSKCIFFDLG